MFHDFPYTDFHELNLDYLLCLCKKSMGLKLEVVGDTLRLVNANHEVISNVTISYAEKALNDVDGKPIKTYILSAGTDGTHVVFTKGDGTVTSIEVPYAEKAKEDLQGKDILDYVYNVSVAGDKLRITKGDLTVAEITVPFATKASTDPDGKEIVTYAASLAAEGNQVVLRDAKGRYLNRITVPYATEAGEAAHAADADTADYATAADRADEADHADAADLAILATDAMNAVESVTISGDNVVFTTYGGRNFTITCPYSVKAQKDELGNNIKSTYVANVTNDPVTGEISFLDATGHEIVALIPTVNKATNDSYNNLIADYVKAIVVSSGSDYVTVTHGTGATDSIKIHYSDTAWKDTNGNVIKNTYIKRLACEEDVQDGHYKLVAYNGDIPEAELFRIPLIADAAKHDSEGNVITEHYAHSMTYNSNVLQLINADGDTLSSVTIDVDEAENVYVIQAADPVANTIEDVSASTAGVAFVAKLSSLNVDIKNSITPSQVLDEIVSNGARAIFLICLGDPTAQPFAPGAINLSAQSELYINGRLTFRDITDKSHLGELVEIFATFSNNAWTLYDLSVVDVEAGATKLSDLDDVQISNIWQGSILQWVGGSAGHWENMQFRTIGPKNVLAYNGPSDNPASTWQPKNIDTSYLSDINVSSPSDGEVLKYDATSQKWVNGSAGGGGGGSSALVVTLTGAYPGATIDLAAMNPNSDITVSADSTYAAIKVADDIIFKIVDTTQTGSKYTLRPTGMYTLNVPADQSLIYTFSVVAPSSNTPKVFTLEIGPWGNIFTFRCVA